MTIKETASPRIGAVFGARAYFDWGWKDWGFGQLSFSADEETGRIFIDNECMTRERVRAILHAFADHIADNGVLNNE